MATATAITTATVQEVIMDRNKGLTPVPSPKERGEIYAHVETQNFASPNIETKTFLDADDADNTVFIF